ncbi:hypothetical protein FB45DRAFT_863184 [Roridomyces roridus]|uniref:Uncharacterized protein n=1 Tax=Roridomyces roridus TaxID=1738132 RepID=A0AAD7CAY1_9AGAR|nr:hypothetical protein FB45DRAFT_863184 [Roridomyces roridus]
MLAVAGASSAAAGGLGSCFFAGVALVDDWIVDRQCIVLEQRAIFQKNATVERRRWWQEARGPINAVQLGSNSEASHNQKNGIQRPHFGSRCTKAKSTNAAVSSIPMEAKEWLVGSENEILCFAGLWRRDEF